MTTPQASQTSQTAGTMCITVNGEQRRVAAGTAVGALMEGADALGSAIARNREVVPRSRWHDVLLSNGDAIEIVRPAQGG